MNNYFVSVIIPCRNEEKLIGKCLDSIIAQDYPREKLEVLVVDGMSEDGTRDIIRRYTQEHSFIRLLDNQKKITPSALNTGIKNAKGEIILRMGAHSRYARDYISKCTDYLRKYDADNVGGVMITIPRDNGLIGKGVAIALSHPFGVGNSVFRVGAKQPEWVDTVFGGCYKKEIFDKIGLFNENLVRGQDMEFNLRLKKAGGKILLVPEITSYYYARSGFKLFFRHNFVNGVWATLPFKFTRIMPVSLRHLVPFIFALSLTGAAILSFFLPFFRGVFLLIVGLYSLTNLYFSIKIVLRKKNIKYLFIMPVLFASLHLGYGFGSIWGAIKLLFPAKRY